MAFRANSQRTKRHRKREEESDRRPLATHGAGDALERARIRQQTVAQTAECADLHRIRRRACTAGLRGEFAWRRTTTALTACFRPDVAISSRLAFRDSRNAFKDGEHTLSIGTNG